MLLRAPKRSLHAEQGVVRGGSVVSRDPRLRRDPCPYFCLPAQTVAGCCVGSRQGCDCGTGCEIDCGCECSCVSDYDCESTSAASAAANSHHDCDRGGDDCRSLFPFNIITIISNEFEGLKRISWNLERNSERASQVLWQINMASKKKFSAAENFHYIKATLFEH